MGTADPGFAGTFRTIQFRRFLDADETSQIESVRMEPGAMLGFLGRAFGLRFEG
jgi:hypothetical protein